MALGVTATPPTAEELELQDQVAKALESQGVLSKIKAQLRAAVFQAIHGNGNGNGSGHGTLTPQSSSLSTILSPHSRQHALGADGHVALEIVRNFLECLELDHTLTVFLAEANLDGKDHDKEYGEWRQPARLCERVGVTKVDEQTPVLIKMLQSNGVTHGGNHSEVQAAIAPQGLTVKPQEQKVSNTRDVAPPKSGLPLPPSLPPSAATLSLQGNPNGNDNDDDGESEMEASMAEEVASGSFEEESLAESASLNSSADFSKTKANAHPGNHRAAQLELNREEDEDEDESPSIASPPPVPAKLGMMPPLPGMPTARVSANLREEESADDEDESDEDKPTARGEKDDDEEEGEEEEEKEEEENAKEGKLDQGMDLEDEDEDDDDAADRLRSLEAKLKEMEAEDDTGVLQQLKVTKLEVPDDGDGDEDKEDAPKPDDASETGARDDEDDENYGSDFEEVEEDVDDDVGSELSEDIASMSALSESEEVSVAQAEASEAALRNDKAVESEDALNSYDYIEAVEKD